MPQSETRRRNEADRRRNYVQLQVRLTHDEAARLDTERERRGVSRQACAAAMIREALGDAPKASRS